MARVRIITTAPERISLDALGAYDIDVVPVPHFDIEPPRRHSFPDLGYKWPPDWIGAVPEYGSLIEAVERYDPASSMVLGFRASEPSLHTPELTRAIEIADARGVPLDIAIDFEI